MTIILSGIAIRLAKRAPMQTLASSIVSPQFGLQNDSRGKPSARQITLLSAESWNKACANYGRHIDWLVRRANLFITGYEFSAEDVGSCFIIGPVILEITKECDPCYRMDEQVAGLQQCLTPAFTAGVCAMVLRGGKVTVGDKAIVTRPSVQASLW